MEQAFGLSAFRSAFEGIHYSHELGMRKPDPAAFLAICEGHGISPERTLFMDDLKQHVEGATQAGLEAHWHHPVDQDVAVRLAKRGFDIPETAYRNQA